jgi:hypothetical protein
MSLADAEALCSSQPTCLGVTFENESATPTGIIPKVYIKSTNGTAPAGGWHSYIKDYVPPPPFPGPAFLRPKVHFAPPIVATHGSWHDIAGAFTHKGRHHIFQGPGWNHAVSADLVRWSVAPHGPNAVHETYKGMDSTSDPCSGFLVQDKYGDGSVCAGFRQCGSSKGVNGSSADVHPWDVPLELRCASDDNLTMWNDANPEYASTLRTEGLLPQSLWGRSVPCVNRACQVPLQRVVLAWHPV